jgi:hypothetical protein
MSPQRLPSFIRNNSNLGQEGFQNDFFSMLGGSSANQAAQAAMRRDTSPTFLTRSMTKEFEDQIGLISPNNILASGKTRKNLMPISPLDSRGSLFNGSLYNSKFLPTFGGTNMF